MKRILVWQRVESPRWPLLALALALALAVAVTAGCNGDSGSPTSPRSGPFRLTFSLDATFQGRHGGQSIAIAIVRASDGSMVIDASGAVSATDNPSFTWSTGPVMEAGIDYEVQAEDSLASFRENFKRPSS